MMKHQIFLTDKRPLVILYWKQNRKCGSNKILNYDDGLGLIRSSVATNLLRL